LVISYFVETSLDKSIILDLTLD